MPALPLALLTLAALACQTVAHAVAPPAPTPPPPTRTPLPPTPIASAASELFYPEQTYFGTLALGSARLPLGECEQPSPFYLPADGLIQVAFLPTGVCFNGEIGLMEIADSLYVVQSAGTYAAFTLADVTDPGRPKSLGAWEWRPGTYTADVKPFRQGPRWYLALSLEGFAFQSGPPAAPCGIAIVEVTDPGRPILVGNYHGRAAGSGAGWCNVHTTEVVTGEDGDGTHLLVSSDDTADLRVLDIRSLPQVREIARYRLADIEFYTDGSPAEFVHDTTITANRVYVSYWGGGLIVLDRAQLTSGGDVEPLNEPRSIDPPGFEIHHSYPTAGEDFVFIEDEVNFNPPDFSQLRLWDIRDLSAPEEAASVALDEPLSPPHNLLVDGDLLYVGWYNDGVRVFRYDVSDPARPSVKPAYSQPVRTERHGGAFGVEYFDGIYGLRLHPCRVDGQEMTCIYASDLTLGLLILALLPEAG